MKPPACAWCGSVATEQIFMGNHNRAGVWQRAYSWLCPCCIRETGRDREVVVRRG